MAVASDSVRRAQPLLGTFVEITVLDASLPNVDDAIERAFETIGRAHRLMSFHDPASDISRLNFCAASDAVKVDSWTYEVLEASIDFHRRSGGAFDITVAPALQNIGLLPLHDRMLPLPADSRLAADPIELLPGSRVRFRDPAIRIDLGGTAKGYAVDRAVETLKESGVESAIVNAGGDLAVFGPRAHVVDIRDSCRPGQILSRIAIRDQALASTGGSFDPFRSLEVAGLAVIDPATQKTADTIVGASVRATSCMVADALTKIVILGGEESLAVLDQYQASAMLISKGGIIQVSDNWKDAIHDAA